MPTNQPPTLSEETTAAVEAIGTALVDADKMLKEPALAVSLPVMLRSAIASGLLMLTAWGVDVGSDRFTTTLHFFAIAIPILAIGWAGLRTRANVYAPETVERLTRGG